MYLLIAAIIRMGIMRLTQRHLYWSRICKTNFISECMNSRRFKQIFSFLHMNDNTVLSDDKLYKIRLLITNLNKTFESAVKYAKKYSVDESIVPFRGKNNLKRYMPGKPHKYGFKIEQLCNRNGYCQRFEVSGDNRLLRIETKYRIGNDAMIVIRLANGLPKGTKLYFDNRYTTIELLKELKIKGLEGTGTMRRNRLHNAPLESEKVMKKRGRGSIDCYSSSDKIIQLTRFHDTKSVTLGSTCFGTTPLSTQNRYEKKEKKSIEIHKPHVIKEYNNNMLGVDMCDMYLALYRQTIRTKKYYKKFFCHFINLACVNSFLIYKNLRSSKVSFLDFLLLLSEELLVKNGKRQVTSSGDNSVRFDGQNHWPAKGQKTKVYCKNYKCKARTSMICKKCDIYLCLNCFESYHIFNK